MEGGRGQGAKGEQVKEKRRGLEHTPSCWIEIGIFTLLVNIFYFYILIFILESHDLL